MSTPHPDTAIDQFLRYLQFEKRLSRHTSLAYQNDLDQFYIFLRDEYDAHPILAVKSTQVRTWLAGLRDAEYDPKSLVRKISALKSFYKYHLRIGSITHSPMSQILAPKLRKRLPSFVREEEIVPLMDRSAFPPGWKGETEALIIQVFYQTGMRVSELVNLKEAQLDLGHGQLKVLGKGNKERIIPIQAALGQQLAGYLAEKRASIEAPNVEYVLVTEKGKPLQARQVYEVVRRYLSEVTTLQQRSPHVLRHSFATHLTNQGADLNAIKELLGHSSLAATQVYTHNSIEKLKQAFQQAHPKA